MIAQGMTSDAKLRALGRCAAFARIPGDALGVLAEMMETESLAAGDALFEQGEPSDRVYVVVSGRLSVFVGGRDEPLRSLGPGDLLGEYGMFLGHTRTAAVRADDEATLLSLGYERFRAFLLQFPEVTLSLLATAVRRLVEAERA